MAREVIPPFATPPPEEVTVAQWDIYPHVSSVAVRSDRLDGWDHTVDLTVSATIQADRSRLASACDLGQRSRFAAVLGWHATGSGLRGTVDSAPLDESDKTRLQGTLDGSRLGGRLRLTAAVVLTEAYDPGQVAPTVTGSTLYRDQRSWLLEGVGNRFPVERLDFRTAGMRHPDAAWVVRWDRLDPEWDAHAAVRLQLNSRHPLAEELTDPQRDDTGILQSVMRRDILWDLVDTAVELDGFEIDPAGWPEGSLGQSLSTLLASLFPDSTVEEVRGLRRDDRPNFEAVLQGGTRFLMPRSSS